MATKENGHLGKLSLGKMNVLVTSILFLAPGMGEQNTESAD